MQFPKPFKSHTNCFRHPSQSYLRPNHRYLSSISASLATLNDKNRSFGLNPTSDISPLSCLRANQTYPLSRNIGAIGVGSFRAYSSISTSFFLCALLSQISYKKQISDKKSFWGSLEDPVRYLIMVFTFMTFSHIVALIAPTAIASQYVEQSWKGAIILSFLWFVQRWKTDIFTLYLSFRDISANSRERIVALDRSSSVGLFVLGLMTFAEAYGVAVQSVLTVGGIGGIAAAIAARDVLGNVLSGVLMQFSKPFSLGDTIKAGSIEGRVVEMDLTTTSLVNPEGIPILVPNSVFSSQWIMNKSRAQWLAVVTKIPLKSDCLEKAPQISDDIKSMLKSNQKVFLGDGVPYCSITSVDSQFAELTIGCNLTKLRKDEFYDAEQDILVKAVRIIEKNGASLGQRTEERRIIGAKDRRSDTLLT